MRCPACGSSPTRVNDSRITGDRSAIRRRRLCEQCGHKFTTYERMEESLPLVIKKDGRREEFAREKILTGIRKACQKRPISFEDTESMVDRIEEAVRKIGEKEVESSYIGEMVMRELKELDKVAYVRFASVYKEFRDISDFMAEVRKLLVARQKPRTGRYKR